jgi:hypothetical protein
MVGRHMHCVRLISFARRVVFYHAAKAYVETNSKYRAKGEKNGKPSI